jgi:hypothetical protein
MSEIKTLSDTAQRVIGVVVMLLGAGLTYLFVVTPYLAMQAGANEVEFGPKSAAIGPALVLGGLILVALGQRTSVVFSQDGANKWKTWVAGILIAAVAFGCYVWLDTQATALGYTEG